MTEVFDRLAIELNNSGVVNFTPRELSPREIPPVELMHNIIPTVILLQKIRSAVDEPIRINSCYRSPVYNRKIGGVSNSLHLQWNAIDWTFTDPDRDKAFAKLKEIAQQFENGEFTTVAPWRGGYVTVSPAQCGLGLYPVSKGCFIHLDTRGLLNRPSPVRW